MEHHDISISEYAAAFVAMFIQERKQERYLEMIRRKKFEKFFEELGSNKIWMNLDENMVLHCKGCVTIHDIAQAHPEIRNVDTYYLMSDQHPCELVSVKASDIFDSRLKWMTGYANVITLQLNRIAVYVMEQHVALCVKLDKSSTPLYTLSKYSALIDHGWYRG